MKDLYIISVVILVALLLLTSQNGWCGVGHPVVTWEITVDAEAKTYTYTIANTLNEISPITNFWIYMPDAGARAVTSFICSDPNWYTYNSFTGSGSHWGLTGGTLSAGSVMQLMLTTLADVPTIDSYDPSPEEPGYSTNWGYYTSIELTPGDSLLPVPSGVIPEPSSLLALGCCLAGLGGLMRRRRREA